MTLVLAAGQRYWGISKHPVVVAGQPLMLGLPGEMLVLWLSAEIGCWCTLQMPASLPLNGSLLLFLFPFLWFCTIKSQQDVEVLEGSTAPPPTSLQIGAEAAGGAELSLKTWFESQGRDDVPKMGKQGWGPCTRTLQGQGQGFLRAAHTGRAAFAAQTFRRVSPTTLA